MKRYSDCYKRRCAEKPSNETIVALRNLDVSEEKMRAANFRIANFVTNMTFDNHVPIWKIEQVCKTAQLNFPAISLRLVEQTGNILLFSTGAACMAGMSTPEERVSAIWAYSKFFRDVGIGAFEPRDLQITNIVLAGHFGKYKIRLSQMASDIKSLVPCQMNYEAEFYPALLVHPIQNPGSGRHKRRFVIAYYASGKINIVGNFNLELYDEVIRLALYYVDKYLYLPKTEFKLNQ